MTCTTVITNKFIPKYFASDSLIKIEPKKTRSINWLESHYGNFRTMENGSSHHHTNPSANNLPLRRSSRSASTTAAEHSNQFQYPLAQSIEYNGGIMEIWRKVSSSSFSRSLSLCPFWALQTLVRYIFGWYSGIFGETFAIQCQKEIEKVIELLFQVLPFFSRSFGPFLPWYKDFVGSFDFQSAFIECLNAQWSSLA